MRRHSFDVHTNRLCYLIVTRITWSVVTLTGGSSNMGLASFLLRTGARDARQIQWGARFVF